MNESRKLSTNLLWRKMIKLRGIKGSLNKWQDVIYSLIGRLNIVNISVFLTLALVQFQIIK